MDTSDRLLLTLIIICLLSMCVISLTRLNRVEKQIEQIQLVIDNSEK